jgi:FixJ family two-component response regulator
MLHTESTLSVAIVDPDPSSRAALSRLVLAYGYHALPFAAIADYGDHVATAGPIALLLIDVRDYLNAGSAQRQSLFGHSAVIALADEARLEDVGQAFAAGCADYLVKPVPPALLLDTMARVAG